MNYEIEKNIPIPENPQSAAPDKLDMLEVGDSILAPRASQCRLTSYGNKYRMKLKSRKVDESTIRIWRVK